MVKLSLEQNSTAMPFYSESIFETQGDHENQRTLYQNLLLVPGVHVELTELRRVARVAFLRSGAC